jgi:inner membrane protein
MNQLLDSLARLARSPAFKFCLISAQILLLLIPLAIVYALIIEREGRANEVRSEVGKIWGPEQQIVGPFLVVPYTVKTEVQQGDKLVEQVTERRAIFTPERLDVRGDVAAKSLKRSIFEVPVFATGLKISGSFAAPRIAEVAADATAVRWRDAAVVLAVSGVTGLKSAAVLKIAGASDVPFSPSLGVPGVSLAGIHAKLASAGSSLQLDPDKEPTAFDFSADLSLNGSVSLGFAPVAQNTVVSITSDWPHPSFDGAFLPDDREVTASGFKATWKIPHLARSVPEAWSDKEAGVERLMPHVFGVRMIEPVDFYSLIDRATKYGVMFITLAFMAVFSLELTTRSSVHPVQYLFTGVALVFFYVLLLSLAEHLGFAAAYLIASVATGSMLAVYIGAVLKSVRMGAVMMAVFSITYLLLYFILQLEDYALLAGALLGFAAMTIVMFATLKVDWSGGALKPAEAKA